LAESTSTANVTFEFVGDRFPSDYSAIFLDYQSDQFPFIEEGTLYLFARLFHRLIRRRHFPADAKRSFKIGVMRDELQGIFLIKKQPVMILANIVFFAI
jgi:hypothetical protein